MRRPARVVMILLLAAATLVACSGSPRLSVRLTDQVEPEIGQPPEAPSPGLAVPLRIAAANVVSPRETFRSYQDLIAYIARRLGRPAELVQRSTYAEINGLVRSGHVDLAFVCDLAYVEGQREFGMEFLVAPVVGGRPEYYSYLIVPVDSAVRSLADLRGSVFAFSDPLSNSGWLVPTYELLRAGERPDTFFRRVIYTYSHDNSIQAVADRLVDGAAVDSLVFDSTVKRRTELERRLRVVTRFGPYAIPPVVVNPALPEARKAELRAIMLSMHEDPEGQRILADLDIERFTVLDDRAFDGVRAMRDAVQRAEQTQR